MIKTKHRLLVGLPLIALIMTCWAFLIEPAGFTLKQHNLALPHWPPACEGLRIAVLSDLHVGSPWNDLEQLEKIVDKTLQSEPDLILIPGDLVIQNVVGGEFIPPEEIVQKLQLLSAPMGVYAVLGNHDHWLGGTLVMQALEEVGIPVLEDRTVGIYKGECRLHLIGISDFMEGQHDYRRALATVTDEIPVLAFTHNPDIFPSLPNDINLTIAGHTHGGQVYIPGIGRPLVPSIFGDQYAIGHIEEDGKHLFVSPGIGTSIIPVRFLVPPEITVLKINRAEKQRSGE